MIQKIAICGPSHNFVRLYLRNEGVYRQSEKNLLNSNISSIHPHSMASLAESCSVVWGTPANFNGFCVLASLLQRRGSPEANQTAWCLAVSWAGILYIHFPGLLLPDGFLPGTKFTLRPSLAFSYVGSVTAWQSSSGCQPNFAAWYKEWNYGTFAEGATYIPQGSHHIFFYHFSFPILSCCILDVYHTWCGLSANLGCGSEMWCMRLTKNTGHKKIPKNSPCEHHRTNLSDYIFATKARIDNQKNTC